MKKSLLLLVFCFLFLSVNQVIASEIDDQNVAQLLANAKKIRSYGDYCWEMEFIGNWKIPFEFDEFRLYVMDTDVIKNPKGNYSYPDFIRHFVRSPQKEFKPKDKALVVCLPVDISFNQFKESIFKPWGQQTKAGSSKSWLFPKFGKGVLAKSGGHYGHTWLTGVRSIQDFMCLGENDPNIIKIDGDTITFKSIGYICFEPTHTKKDGWADNLFADKWEDENGENQLGKRLEANQTYTLHFLRQYNLPKGWDN